MTLTLLLSACQAVPAHQSAKPTEMAEARTALAAQYLALHDLDSAVRQAQMALSHQADYAPALRVLGIIYATEGSAANIARADSYFKAAMQKDSTDMATQFAYANFLQKIGQTEAALAYYEKAASVLGFEGRLTAIENIAYLHYQAWQISPTAAHKQQAQLSLQRAISAGSQQSELIKAAQSLAAN